MTNVLKKTLIIAALSFVYPLLYVSRFVFGLGHVETIFIGVLYCLVVFILSSMTIKKEESIPNEEHRLCDSKESCFVDNGGAYGHTGVNICKFNYEGTCVLNKERNPNVQDR